MNNTECPICFDVIDADVNCITTECRHRFHAKCLFANIAHNGFACPSCRSSMAERQVNLDDDEQEITVEPDEEEWQEHLALEEEEEERIQVEREQRQEEEWQEHMRRLDAYDAERQDHLIQMALEEEEKEEEKEIPSVSYIGERLASEYKYTQEEILTALLSVEFTKYESAYGSLSNEIYKKIALIIENYKRREEEPELPTSNKYTFHQTIDYAMLVIKNTPNVGLDYRDAEV